ncbi:uncharacterized protein N7529_002091 [Penicillium soppii]|uniref:uncharacterized protein n=1 Tax=Penicillium soppii TaxID=69789 RepID=UPI002546C5F3|nr:uncharacterized protein N7529_002091 [Penicillium soppii]KAJ5876507.1 hypothetical protein N7529_002091 [Penicillium soppii]
MPGFVEILNKVTPTIVLFGIIVLNGYYYYVAHEGCHHLDHLLLTNFVGASISPLSIEGQPVPDRWFHMILDGPLQTPVSAIAGGIKELSNQHDCRVMSGSINGISWSYHSMGAHCDTTAQLDTIAGAIKKYLDKSEHYKVCGTQCLRLEHGGTWNGWLKFGPASGFNKNAYCGPGLSFSGCISGGNNGL